MENVGGMPLSCPLCGITFSNNEEMERHRSSPKHIFKWLKHWYSNNKQILGMDKNNVKISIKQQENIVVHGSTVYIDLLEGEKIDIVMQVQNNANVCVYLRKIGLLSPTKSVSLHDEHEVAQEKRCVKVNPGVMYEVIASVTGTELGVLEIPVAFQLRLEESKQLFFIVKTLVLSVEDAVARDCAVEEPYLENKLRYSVVPQYNESFEPGVPPPFEIEDQLERERIKQHYYRPDLVDIANKNFEARKLVGPKRAEAHRIRAMLDMGLKMETHREWFQTMMWLEEMQLRTDFTSYNMEDSCLTTVTQDPFRHCIGLQVPGLAENRPSVLRGDSVFVKLDKRKEKYEGRVHHVVEDKVYLAFGPKFMGKFINNMKVKVEFSFNRLPFCCAHEAVCKAERNNLTHLLFPTKPTSSVIPPVIKPLNRNVEENPEQLQAVRQILCKSSLPGPYIIFGPPGTGKTITVVESIKQVYIRNPGSHIVACGPSNTAADLIALRLLEHVSKKHIIRMYAASRSLEEIPEELKAVSNVKKTIYFPSLAVLKDYRIIVCTLVTAARLVGAKFPTDHFSYIFIDECGQAPEPETLIPIAGLASKNTQVVLAGDPQQLGPVIRNPKCFSSERFFSGNGLDKSYLERMMEMEMFKPQNGKYDQRVVTKLLNNYRSHEAILKLPNDLFYQSELKVCADRMLTHSLCSWEGLPKKNFPMVFQGVRGKDEKESFSPSYFNAQEVSVVISYIKKLLDIKNPKMRPEDIGVITPYRRQVQKIRKQVTKYLPHLRTTLKVGTPEEFQGNERKVIVISTVRATANYLEEDNKFKIGFLKNPKRFNVAVTRAKALVIVVGQAEVLQFDPFWGKLYLYIKEHGGYTGHSVNREPENVEEIVRCFSQLNIGMKSFENTSEPSARELAEAPGWGANI